MTSDFMKWIEEAVVPEIKKKYGLKITPDTMIYADTYETRSQIFDRMYSSQGTDDPWKSGWIELEDKYGNIADFHWQYKNDKISVTKSPDWKKDFWGVRK